MKKKITALTVGGIALAVGLTLMLTLNPSQTAQATNTPGNTITDHALLNGITGGDVAVGCKSDKSFVVYITMRAFSAPATFTVHFVNDTTGLSVDSITFPLGAADQIVSITQAAGGTPDVDTHLVVEVTAGQIIGWMSLSTQTGSLGFDSADVDYCRTYQMVGAARTDN